MPTVFLIDPLLISTPKADPEYADNIFYAPFHFIVQGLYKLLDFISANSKFEFVSLVTFSSKCEILTPFTRDMDSVKAKLGHIKLQESSNIEAGLFGVEKLVLAEWGSGISCNVILVTQGNYALPNNFNLPFTFPGNFIVCLIGSQFSVNSSLSHLNTHPQKVHVIQPEYPITALSIQHFFLKVGEMYYTPWTGSLTCGNFNCKVTLTPSPEPYTKITDFDTVTYIMENTLEICGFIELKHLGSPGAISRHLVIPCPSASVNPSFTPSGTSPMETDDEDSTDDHQTPNFCVLLHGALKVENMAALCYLGNDWYGVLFSWADSKKKSNLMLSLLEPGEDAIPWLGDLSDMEIPDFPTNEDTFPLRPTEKKSYTQNCVAWIRQPGLQSDIQKILRHARKIPEKTQQFYKELNRVRRAAICLGFVSLLEGLAAILERECTLLPGTAHPACAFQLSHAAGVLREPYSRDPKYNIVPMKMSF